MVQIGDNWNREDSNGPPLCFVDGRNGNSVRLSTVDAKSGEKVPTNQIKARPGRGADELTRWRLTHIQ